MKKINISKDVLEKLYVEEKRSSKEIGAYLGVSRQTIINKLREHGIEIRPTKISDKPKEPTIEQAPMYQNKDDFKSIYESLKSIPLVAEHYKIDSKTAYIWKKRHGIETVKGLSDEAIKSKNEGKPYTDKVYLEKMYSKYSTYELSEIWNCSPSTIQKWLKRLDIPRRNCGEQWRRKPKNGIVILKDDGFDLQEYLNTYNTSKKINKHLVQRIKDIVGKCQSCGEIDVLDLHHINEQPKDNRPENHIILCPNCHAKIHRLGITVEELCPDFKDWSKILNDTYAEAK